MTHAHTQRPKWVATDNHDGTQTIGFMQEDWRDFDGAPEITVAENVPNEYARLIAAAPELLEALKSAREAIVSEYNVICDVAAPTYANPLIGFLKSKIDQIDAAITKATGGTV